MHLRRNTRFFPQKHRSAGHPSPQGWRKMPYPLPSDFGKWLTTAPPQQENGDQGRGNSSSRRASTERSVPEHHSQPVGGSPRWKGCSKPNWEAGKWHDVLLLRRSSCLLTSSALQEQRPERPQGCWHCRDVLQAAFELSLRSLPSTAQHCSEKFSARALPASCFNYHSQSRAWKRQGHRAAGAQSTLSRRSQRRRGARGGDDSAVARESQQTAAALHAALCSGAATGAGPCPSVTPPCQHSFAPGPSRFRAVPRDPPALWLADTCSTSVSESLLSLSAGAALTGTLGRELAAGTAAFRCPALLTGWGGAVFGA